MTKGKLDSFANMIQNVFINEIENDVFDKEVKTDVTLHRLLFPILNICVFHDYHLGLWKEAWAMMIHKPNKIK